MQQNITRRIFIKKTLGALLTCIGIGSGGYFYARTIEPALLDIQTVQIRHPLIPASFDGVKMVQFSDTHLGFQYTLRQFAGLMQKINELKPDIVFFTGDLMDAPNRYKDLEKIAPVLAKLHASLGKFCIYGNHDHGGYGSELYKQIMEDADFTLLLNESVILEKKNSRIGIAGIDDAMLGRPDIRAATQHIPDHIFTLLLSHAPDLADAASYYKIDWQLSGHSHGGQVKLPCFGALVTPPFARKYLEGHYLLGQARKLHLYVNRGIGTTRLPFRFMAKPELTVFTLQSLPQGKAI